MAKPTPARPRVARLAPEAAGTGADDTSADYVDVFEVEKSEPDDRSPEQLTRLAFSRTPSWWRRGIAWAHRSLLRFRLAPGDEADRVVGWLITESSATLLRLEAAGPLMNATLLVVRTGPTRVQLVTALSFHRPVLARLVWAVVGPVHRRAAPALMARAAAP